MKTTLLGIAALAAVVAVPGLSFAQTYAYVNSSGEVMTMDAANANTALTTAPDIGVHSGVMEVGADDAGVVGDKVSGV